MGQPYSPVANAGLLYANGLQFSYTSSAVLSLGAGAARDSTNVNDIILGSTVTISGGVTGANGVDVSVVSSGNMYGLWLIGDSTDYNPTAGLLSLATNSSPTLPEGYDMSRRIGYVNTSTGNAGFLKFYQYGVDEKRSYYYDVGISALSAGSSATFANINLNSSVPPLATTVNFDIAYTAASSGGIAQFLPYGSTATSGIVRFGCGAAAVQVGSIVVPSQLSSGVAEVQYKVGASDALTLLTTGFSDFIS